MIFSEALYDTEHLYSQTFRTFLPLRPPFISLYLDFFSFLMSGVFTEYKNSRKCSKEESVPLNSLKIRAEKELIPRELQKT